MSPDIEWQITDESEQQTIIKTPDPRPPRWRVWVVILIVTLGAGLGMVYRSIPEPPARPPDTPTPTATPAAMPPALFQVVDREAQALADGNSSAFTSGLNTTGTQRYRFQRGALTAWGRPTDGSQSLYTILSFKLLTADSAGVDVRQYRAGRYFRETRFYRLRNGQWLRSGPDPLFWSGEEASSDTTHFHVTYAVEDRNLALPVIQQLEEEYHRLCQDLACTTTNACPESPDLAGCNPIEHEMTFTLELSPDVGQAFYPAMSDSNDLRFPSPRVMGVFEQGDPIGPENSNNLVLLAQRMAQHIAYGAAKSTSPYQDGAVILRAIALWASNRAEAFPNNSGFGAFTFMPDPQQLLPLEALWGRTDGSNFRQKSREAYAVIGFVEQTYGPQSVAKLLGALGQAQSFSEAIETGLGVPSTGFEQKWVAWSRNHWLK